LTLERCESFVDFANKTDQELDSPVVFTVPEPTNAQVVAAVQLYRERLVAEATTRSPLKESEVQKYEQTAQGLFLREHEIWKSDRKEFNERCLKIVEIFRKYLGQSITTLSLTDLLREQKFRRVWKQINEQYGVQSRNPAQIVALRKSLDSIKLNGQQKLSGIIDQFDSIFVMLSSAGSEVDDSEKMEYLHQALTCSGSVLKPQLVETIGFYYQSKKSYADTCFQLRVVESSRQLQHDYLKPQSEIQINAANGEKERKKGGKAKCQKCGKGHATENCWRDTTCSHCHQKGHPAEKCWKNPRSSAFRGESSNSTENSSKRVRLDEEDDDEVRLQNMFTQKVNKMLKKK